MTWLRRNWRGLLARLPLPTLALAASYGVGSFAALFVPWPIAIVQAAAFELTYIGLAIVEVPERDRRRRATKISLSAVAVSVVYNSAAGYFHRNPAALVGLSFAEELALAVAHGAPLAIVAYLVADLLFHTRDRAQLPRQRRGLICRLTRALRDTRAQLAAAQSDRAALVGQLATAQADAAQQAAELAELRAAAARAATTVEEAARLREQLRAQQQEITRLRERPPTQAAIVAYARGQLARDRPLLDVARELGMSESTLRGWLKITTNGHLAATE